VRSVRTRRPRCRRIIHETDASMGAASRCPGFSSTQRMSLSGLRTSSFSPKSRRVLCLWNSSHRSLRLGSHFARVGPTHRSIEHAIGRVGRSDRSAQQQPQFSSPARPSRGARRTRTSGAASAPRHRKESPHDVRREHHSEAEARVGPGACGRGVMKA